MVWKSGVFGLIWKVVGEGWIWVIFCNRNWVVFGNCGFLLNCGIVVVFCFIIGVDVIIFVWGFLVIVNVFCWFFVLIGIVWEII